jgi:SAM-dependent methyltransferase
MHFGLADAIPAEAAVVDLEIGGIIIISSQASPNLKPRVEVACVVCGNQQHDVVCSADEVQAHLAYLHAFHRRRLRLADRYSAPAALTERAEFTQDYATNIVACTNCGLVFRDPRPDAGAIRHAYERDRYGHERLRALFDSQVELFRPKARYLRRWLRSGPETFVVELGSFVGGFLAAGRECGWRIAGIDPGEEVAAFCEQQGFQVLRETIEEATLPAASAHCVAIWNTFDQIVNPKATLRNVQRLLRPGGILAVRVPNGEGFRRAVDWQRRLPRPFSGVVRAAMAWNNLLAFPYLDGYSERTLDRLLTRYGMRRLAVVPDVLARLADAQTKTWAAWEERALKRAWQMAARLDATRPGRTGTLAPWFDAYYVCGESGAT